jgi:hypothetical protein
MDKFLYALAGAIPPLLASVLIGVFLIWRKMRITGWVIIALGVLWSLFSFQFSWNWRGGPTGTGAFSDVEEQITTPAFIV